MLKTKPKEIKALLRKKGMSIAGMARRLRNDKHGDIDRTELDRRIHGVRLEDKYIHPIAEYLGETDELKKDKVGRIRYLFGLEE